LLLLTCNLSAQYTYEANQALIDLTNQSGITSLNSGDDQVSNAFNLGFTFKLYGEEFTQGRMATNGCLHFKTSGSYCSDYTPDPLANQFTYTLLPFWTDLIRDSGSSMLAKSFDDKTVFGWYDMREFNRASDNSFEVILWTNDTFEYRYGALDINNHDVLIGEIGSGSSEIYQYLYHDECNTGSTNSSSCVSTDWNNIDKNTNLENGGSLYGVGSGNALDCSNVLNSSACAGYAAAYQAQQCDLDQLSNEACPNYWDAYDDQQCDLNSQYSPSCSGYRQEDSVAYYDNETDYGYTEEDMWYDEEYDEWLDPNDPCYENRCEGFTDADWYALDAEQFGQAQVDEWFGADISFNENGTVEWDSTPMDSYDDVEEYMDVWDMEQDTIRQEEMMLEEFLFQESFLVEDYREPETFIELETITQLEEWFEEETEHHEERNEEEALAIAEAEEEEFIEPIFEEEAVEEIFEAIEERVAEAAVEEREERAEAITEDVVTGEFRPSDKEGKSFLARKMALSVVSSTLRTAKGSVSGTMSGNSIHATGGTTGAVEASASSSSGGMGMSSSPSISEQFASSSAQTNQLLSMSFNSDASSSMSSEVVEVETVSTSLSVDTTTTQTIQNQIDVSVSTETTASDSDLIADKILAQNIEAAQDDVATQQEETGTYGAEDTIIAYMGFVPDFNSYRSVAIPQKETWYEPRSIYANNMLADNIEGFYQMAGHSINILTEMKRLQPNL